MWDKYTIKTKKWQKKLDKTTTNWKAKILNGHKNTQMSTNWDKMSTKRHNMTTNEWRPHLQKGPLDT